MNFFFLSPQSSALHCLTPPAPGNFWKLPTGVVIASPWLFPPASSAAHAPTFIVVVLSAKFILFFTILMVLEILSSPKTLIITYLDKFQISPSIHFPLPPTLLSILPLCPSSSHSPVQISHLSLPSISIFSRVWLPSPSCSWASQGSLLLECNRQGGPSQ